MTSAENMQQNPHLRHRTLIYARERFPLMTYLPLCVGVAISGRLISGSLGTSSFVVGLAYLLIFFFELRLMDEVKDFEKDQIVNPSRPIARGLLSLREAMDLISLLEGLLVVLSIYAGFTFQPLAALLGIVTAGYLWLMFKEFYVGASLGNHPLTYAWTHQAVLVPLVLFVTALEPQTTLATSAPKTWFALSILGAFYSYEVCRKLDPASHLLNKTYLKTHGPRVTMLFVAGLVLLQLYASRQIGLMEISFFSIIPFAASLLIPVLMPTRFKITEGLSALNLMVQVWAPVIKFWKEGVS